MNLGADTIVAVLRDISNGVPMNESEIPMTNEVMTFWSDTQKQIAELPKGATVDVPVDGNDDDYLAKPCSSKCHHKLRPTRKWESGN